LGVVMLEQKIKYLNLDKFALPNEMIKDFSKDIKLFKYQI